MLTATVLGSAAALQPRLFAREQIARDRSLGAYQIAQAPIVAQSSLAEQEAYAIGIEAFIYFYPLISMDITRRVLTNAVPGKADVAPMNQFLHRREFPDANFRVVVRPNFDTLYSSAWIDLTQEPIVASAPDTQGRYYMLPMLDMWSDVFAVPGKRTSGTAAANWALVPMGWRGELPAGVERIDAPTPYVWLIGRTQTNGPQDYAAVHQVQDGYQLTPLSQWGQTPQPVQSVFDPTVDMETDPLMQVNTMPADRYFSYGAELMKINPPHLTDWSILARMKRLGIEPGKRFDFAALPSSVQQQLARATEDGLQMLVEKQSVLAPIVNGWRVSTDSIGVYGNFYLKRAMTALIGLGANPPEDAIYPVVVTDVDGQPVTGANNYVLHFDPDELPPVDAFWSITMYDAEGFQVANPLNRFAIGDRDSLNFNPDGSLDLYIQHASPGADQESNWLPAPAEGTLGITMRLYAPKPEVLDRSWAPPPIQRVS